MDDPSLWIALAAAVIGCYLAACNFALRHFSRSKLAELLEKKQRRDDYDAFLQRLDGLHLMIATLRAAMHLIVLLAVINFIRVTWVDLAPVPRYGYAFLVAGFIVSVFGIAVPVSIARYFPEALLARSLRVLTGLLWLFTPLVRLLHAFDPVVRRLTGGEARDNDDDALTDEVMSVVEVHEQSAGVDEEQKDMLEAVFEFRRTTVGEIMTPRTDIEGVDVSVSLEDLKERIVDIGHSRIPVYDDNLDNLVGMLYVKDLIPFVGKDPNGTFSLRDLLREPMMVPETKAVRELLEEFKADKVHLAIVLDEYGGTAGLVTIEDILEEIVGEIQDEYEPPEETPPGIERLDDGALLVDARFHVDDLNDEVDAGLPEDGDFDTVGGFVFAELGHVPETGEAFDYEGIRVTVIDAERTRVNRVRLEWPKADNGRNGEGGK